MEELRHHGIKGMKWGKRRFQNADGTLTPAGIKRYGRAGYSDDSYKENKTIIGKAYDKYTGAHKLDGKLRYAIASEAERKERAEKYVSDKNAIAKSKKDKLNSNIKDYREKHKRAIELQDEADEKWKEPRELYKTLGKNRISRILNAAKGTSVESQTYNKAVVDASDLEDRAFDADIAMREAYKKTGKTRITRILNNMKYDMDEVKKRR